MVVVCLLQGLLAMMLCILVNSSIADRYAYKRGWFHIGLVLCNFVATITKWVADKPLGSQIKLQMAGATVPSPWSPISPDIAMISFLYPDDIPTK